MTFTENRIDGEVTEFDLFEPNGAAAELLIEILRHQSATQESELFRYTEAYKQLKNYSAVRGVWISTDSDTDAAAVDIMAKIRRDYGFETKISMFTNSGYPIAGDCFSGTFLIQRVSN